MSIAPVAGVGLAGAVCIGRAWLGWFKTLAGTQVLELYLVGSNCIGLAWCVFRYLSDFS